MVDLTLRLAKGSELTYNELDDNQSNLNDAITALEDLVQIGYAPTISADLRGVPAANALMVRRVFTQSWTFPIGLAGSIFNSSTAASGSSFFLIKKNAVTIGQVDFTVGETVGVFTFLAAVTFDETDIFTIEADGTVDASLSDLYLSIQADSVAGAVLSTYPTDYYADTGTDAAIQLDAVGLTVIPSNYFNGMRVSFTAVNVPTDTPTLQVGNLGAESLFLQGEVIAAGDWVAGLSIDARYETAIGGFNIHNIFVPDLAMTQLSDVTGAPEDSFVPVYDNGTGLFNFRLLSALELDNTDLGAIQVDDLVQWNGTNLVPYTIPAVVEAIAVGGWYFTDEDYADSSEVAAALGYGTWIPTSKARVPIGSGIGNDGVEAVEIARGDLGGLYNVTLALTQIPAHTHNVSAANGGDGSAIVKYETDSTGPTNFATSSAGGGGAHENMMPYQGVNIWKRTA